MNASDIFETNLTDLEHDLGVSLPGDSLGARFAALARHVETDGPHGAVPVILGQVRKMRKKQFHSSKLNAADGSVDYTRLVSNHLYACLVNGIAKSGAVNPVRLQHWVPVTYLRAFNDSTVSASRRAVKIRRTDYRAGDSGKAENTFSNGKELCHRPNQGHGFFDNEVEVFFSEVEGHYTSAARIFDRLISFADKRTDVQIASYVRDHVGTAKLVETLGLFVIQSVRATKSHPEHRPGSLSAVVDAMLASMKTLGTMDAHLVGLPGKRDYPPLVFSPVTNLSRAAQMVYGGTGVHYFPLAPRIALLVADGGLKFDASWKVDDYATLVTRFNRDLVTTARILGHAVYGSNAPSLAKWFPVSPAVTADSTPRQVVRIAA